MLNVAIAVDSATDFGPAAARVVSAACEEVIGESRCPLASELRPGTVAAWYAVVHPDDPRLSSLRIEFRDRSADGVLIEQRSLSFSGRDSAKSRLASAGSVIAALVAAREGSVARPPPAPPPEPTRPDWGVDASALVAPALGDGPTRWGGLGRAHVGFLGRPFLLAAGSYAAHAGTPRFTWWTVSAGVGTRVRERAVRFNLEPRVELVWQHTRVAADRGAAHDSAGAYGWGGRVGVDAVWATWRHCWVVVGVDGTFVLPRVDVVVADAPPERISAASLGVSLGVRVLP